MQTSEQRGYEALVTLRAKVELLEKQDRSWQRRAANPAAIHSLVEERGAWRARLNAVVAELVEWIQIAIDLGDERLATRFKSLVLDLEEL